MLKAAPVAAAGALTLDFAEWPRASTRMADDGLHAILRIRGRRPVRLLIQDGAPSGAPLAAMVPLDDDTPMRLAAVQRLLHTLKSTPRRAERDPFTSMRRTRLVYMLRALDGRLAGATHRAIAETLFRIPQMSAREWKGHSQRSRTLRLVADAMNLMRGGYLALLRL